MKMLKTAIVGATGYTGEELIRLLLNHPNVEISCITSREFSGQRIGERFPRFGEIDLKFSEPCIEELASKAEVAFLCLPHGKSAAFAIPLNKLGMRILDLGADFRLSSAKTYEHSRSEPDPASAV